MNFLYLQKFRWLSKFGATNYFLPTFHCARNVRYIPHNLYALSRVRLLPDFFHKCVNTSPHKRYHLPMNETVMWECSELINPVNEMEHPLFSASNENKRVWQWFSWATKGQCTSGWLTHKVLTWATKYWAARQLPWGRGGGVGACWAPPSDCTQQHVHIHVAIIVHCPTPSSYR